MRPIESLSRFSFLPLIQTLLDCVLVWNHAFGKPALMVIDVYAVEGERIAVKYMRSRIDAIRFLLFAI